MKLPTFFISHGGGPWPAMDFPEPHPYRALERSFKDMPNQLGGQVPRAILIISGHWEAPNFTVQAHPNPKMIYDYYGFPANTYELQYPAPGDPDLAQKICGLIDGATLDYERGFDHGTFVPLMVIYPEAEIPVVQVSMRQGYDPRVHFEMGQSLAPLREEGILIIGSGLTYHNLRAFGAAGREASANFDRWLWQTLERPPGAREAALFDWSKAPSARVAHPREDHLIPLMVALGAAANEGATRVYHEDNFFGALTVSSYRFGNELRTLNTTGSI